MRKNIDFHRNKLERYYIKKDIEKAQNSQSLIFSNYLNYQNQISQYFNWIKNLDLLRPLVQLRLANVHNTRIILNNKILIPRKNEYCYACYTNNDLYHMLNDCIYFIRERDISGIEQNIPLVELLLNINN